MSKVKEIPIIMQHGRCPPLCPSLSRNDDPKGKINYTQVNDVKPFEDIRAKPLNLTQSQSDQLTTRNPRG